MWLPRKKFDEIKAQVDELNRALAEVKDAAVLTGIERVGSVNKFTFLRDGKTVVVETYGTISDNLPQWKEELLR